MKLLEHSPDILTIQESAEILRVSTDTIQELIAMQELSYTPIGDQILICKTDLCAYIDKQRQVCYSNNEMHLDNHIDADSMLCSEGVPEMATKISQSILINGSKRWITATGLQEFADKIAKCYSSPVSNEKTLFEPYAWNWFKTYSAPNIEAVTAITYGRQLTKYLCPTFSGMYIEDITTDDIQRLFNGMDGAKATKDKVRIVLNQILDAAVEDKILSSNPLKSKRLRITGNASKPTVPYSIAQMKYLAQHLTDIKNPMDQAYLAIQLFHPLRLEEVLGLSPFDIDMESMSIHVHRAVTHPSRNQPVVKDTKTDCSVRTIALVSQAFPSLGNLCLGPHARFLIGEDKPLSYTQVRRMCKRIKRDTGFHENITPIRFRSTVLTDIYDQTKDIKLAQYAAGHTTSAMTLKYYVKGRETYAGAAVAVEQAYNVGQKLVT